MKFRLNNYNFDEQKFTFTINIPIKEGQIHIKDIDLGCTIYNINVVDINPGHSFWCYPTTKAGFDFDKENFGGFEIDLIDQGEIIDRIFLRFRYTGLDKLRFPFNDGFHPTWMNYREFFVDGLYDSYDFSNLDTVVDAGASIGLFTKFILQQGANKVIPIEADPRSIKYLNYNFGLNPKVKVIHSALSSTLGQAEFTLSNNPLNSSLDNSVGDNTYTVNLINLETLLQKYGNIDLLKLDIEGGEWDVLLNTPAYVFNNIDKILLEYHNNQGRLGQVTSKLESLGFFNKGVYNSSNNGELGNIYYHKQ